MTGLHWIDTSAGMKRAFRNRAFPTLESLGLPFMELPEVNSLGASPMKATTFCTRSHVSNIWSSARMAATVASPTPGIDLRRSLFICEIWITLDAIGDLLFECFDLSVQIGNMFPY